MATAATATQSKPQENDWTKPQAMAIPEGGFPAKASAPAALILLDTPGRPVHREGA